jgi:hypothetical protein
MRSDKFRMLQCFASAKTILLSLGIERSMIPKAFSREDGKIEFRVERCEPFNPNAGRIKRHRRTKKEMKQLKEFEAWQLKQRSK